MQAKTERTPAQESQEQVRPVSNADLERAIADLQSELIGLVLMRVYYEDLLQRLHVTVSQSDSGTQGTWEHTLSELSAMVRLLRTTAGQLRTLISGLRSSHLTTRIEVTNRNPDEPGQLKLPGL